VAFLSTNDENRVVCHFYQIISRKTATAEAKKVLKKKTRIADTKYLFTSSKIM
jgi:hypothetical protein